MKLKPKKICLLSDHHISVNPRLWKEAFFFEKLGYHVVVLTMWHSSELYNKDKFLLVGYKVDYKSYLNVIPDKISTANLLYFRIRKKLFGLIQKYFKIGTGWALSYSPGLMYRYAIEENADIYIAHLECAFFVGRKLIKAGKKVAFDFEDWYSNDYLIPERPVTLLKQIERFAIRNAIYVTAASNSMSNALISAYHSNRPIHTVYNGFPISESQSLKKIIKNRNFDDEINILWFSRTIGPNRGIEKFIEGLKFCKRKISLTLLGFVVEGYENHIKQQMNLMEYANVYFHQFIDHKKLLQFISQFDIGLAIEENINQNKNLTVSNKLLQYLQAGIHVISSDTQGHREIQEKCPLFIEIIDLEDPLSIANTIENINIKEWEKHSFDYNTFNSLFSWEAQTVRLEKLIQNYV
jgi:glycosyltransferase involved in cell wall biosynthesis